MTDVLGAVLCGGAGRRLGEPKATALLGGRPLAAYPAEALRAAGLEVVLVTRQDAPVPDLGIPVIQDVHPVRHPLSGILAALDHAAPRAVLAVATDVPFVTAALLDRIARSTAAVATPQTPDGRLHPLCARYAQSARPGLEAALTAEAPLQRAVCALHPHLVAVDDPHPLTNINDPRDLARAEAFLRSTPAPPSSRSAPRP